MEEALDKGLNGKRLSVVGFDEMTTDIDDEMDSSDGRLALRIAINKLQQVGGSVW